MYSLSQKITNILNTLILMLTKKYFQKIMLLTAIIMQDIIIKYKIILL